MKPHPRRPLKRSFLLTIPLLALAACDRPVPRDSNSAAGAPAASAPLSKATWTISATGFGPLIAGMSAADAVAATQGSLSVPAASSAEQCVYAAWPQAPRGVFVMFEGGTLARVEVREPGIATPEGLEVGASLARAESLYTGATRTPHKYDKGEYFVVRPLAPADTLHRLVIEVIQGRVRTFRVGRFPPVEYVEGCS